MAQRYHINKHGVPAICKAKKGNCPLGGDENHFTNIEEAQEHADKINEEKYGILNNVITEASDYEIPEGAEHKVNINKKEFLENNHQLKKSKENWVYLDEDENVIGIMKDPIVLYGENGELLEIMDKEDSSVQTAVHNLQTMKILSKYNLINSDKYNILESVHLYSPTENAEEYKEDHKEKVSRAEIRSLEGLKRVLEIKGAHQTADLFNRDENDPMARYFEQNELENKTNEATGISYDPETDDLSGLPSAKTFSTKVWKDNNLDLQQVNGKWYAVDGEGKLYGSLENPAAAINFETETIEEIGEADEVEENCRNSKRHPALTEGNPSAIDKLGSVKFDSKNNNLGKVRNLLSYSWAFR